MGHLPTPDSVHRKIYLENIKPLVNIGSFGVLMLMIDVNTIDYSKGILDGL